MDIPGTRQLGQRPFSAGGGLGAQATPTPTPSSAVPQDVRHTLPGPSGPPTPRPTSRAPSGEGGQRGLLQLRLTQPPVPATSSGPLSPLTVLPGRSPQGSSAGLSRGPGQSLEVLVGLQSSAPSPALRLSTSAFGRTWPGLALLVATPGRAPGPRRLAPVSSAASVCLGQDKG